MDIFLAARDSARDRAEATSGARRDAAVDRKRKGGVLDAMANMHLTAAAAVPAAVPAPPPAAAPPAAQPLFTVEARAHNARGPYQEKGTLLQEVLLARFAVRVGPTQAGRNAGIFGYRDWVPQQTVSDWVARLPQLEAELAGVEPRLFSDDVEQKLANKANKAHSHVPLGVKKAVAAAIDKDAAEGGETTTDFVRDQFLILGFDVSPSFLADFRYGEGFSLRTPQPRSAAEVFLFLAVFCFFFINSVSFFSSLRWRTRRKSRPRSESFGTT